MKPNSKNMGCRKFPWQYYIRNDENVINGREKFKNVHVCLAGKASLWFCRIHFFTQYLTR